MFTALPRQIDIDAVTYVKVLRANDPDEDAAGGEGMVSPLFVNQNDTCPEILIALNRENKIQTLFALKQVDAVLVNESIDRDEIFPAANHPRENPP